MRRFLHENRLLVTGFALFLAVAVVFAIGTYRKARNFDVAQEQPLAAWMTPRYVSHSWDVPRDEMLAILGLEPGDGRMTLTDIATERGIPVKDYITDIETSIAAFRAKRLPE